MCCRGTTKSSGHTTKKDCSAEGIGAGLNEICTVHYRTERITMESNIFGSKISAARKKLNLSQAQLADQLFISPQAVGKWERGESTPDIITVSKLAQVLGVDLNFFFYASPTSAAEEVQPMVPQVAAVPAVEKRSKPSWDMSRYIWADADFSGLKDLHEKFSGSDIRNCKFISSDLAGLLFKGNHIEGCDLRGSELTNSRFHSSHVANVQFNDCVLKEAEFSLSTIKGCDFSGADLTGATVRLSNFHKCIVTSALFQRTVFHSTDITDVVFEGVLEDCTFENCAFAKVTFRNSTLLNTFFKSRSLKKVSFIDCRTDRMTYEFLKNGKADLGGVRVIEP